MLAAFAHIGIDLRPVLRRARDAILRPVRQELTLETAVLREQLEARLAAMAERLDEETRKRQALEAQLAEVASQASAEADARRHLTAGLADLAVRIEAERSERRARLAVIEALITEHRPLSTGLARFVRDAPSPLVSIIMPTRDRARFVCDAIASVQAQRFVDWELIIIDDGSKDDTAAVVAPYLEDNRIRFVQQPPKGVSAARNHGLNTARGSLIAYLDSDNVWYPDFIAAAVEAFATDAAVNVIYGVLVTDSHQLDGTQLLFRPFDRDRLLSANYIDMNVIAHRASLVERYGTFDEGLSRLNDWDLVLRYTQDVPARPLPVLAARYRVCDDLRVTTTVPLGPELFAVKRKWYPPAGLARRPRVLYVLWQYPQLSETYIEGEIRCMLRWGAHVEVWREGQPATPHPTCVTIHDGPLPDVVERVRPDVIHVHWLGFATTNATLLAQLGVPVTLRLHGFDTHPQGCRTLLENPWIRAVYGFPHHLEQLDCADPRLRAVPAAFNTALFRPHADKDRRLVVRTAAALPSKDLAFFFRAGEPASRLPFRALRHHLHP
jgi:glycosyltransferase involved in cell wall biosynthesis